MLAVRGYRVHNLVAANADAFAVTFNQRLPYTRLQFGSCPSSIGWQRIDKPSWGTLAVHRLAERIQKPYQLFKIPTANLHVALVLIQALGEGLCIIIAAASAPAVVLVIGFLTLG